MKNKILIWDYDGTLVDSRLKNLNVTRRIIKKVTGNPADSFPLLRSVETYIHTIITFRNWRDFYAESFDLDENQIDRAGILWTEEQLADKTESPLISGMKRLIEQFADYKQGIVSQNSQRMIIQNLKKYGISRFFDVVIGYEEVGLGDQKPNPQGLLSAINKLAENNSSKVYYIGDQDSDVECAFNAKKMTLAKDLEIVSIYLNSFGIPFNSEKLSFQPDYEICKPTELEEIILNF
ncbi:HAD family hydrolase [Bacteroidota bacterium]